MPLFDDVATATLSVTKNMQTARLSNLLSHFGVADLGGALDVNYLSGECISVTPVVAPLNFFVIAPFVVRKTGIISRLAIVQTAAGAGGAVGVWGVYKSNPLTGNPVGQPLLTTSGSVALDGANGLKSFNPNLSTNFGDLLWLASNFGVAAATIQQLNGVTGLNSLGVGAAPITAQTVLFVASAFAPLPAVCPGGLQFSPNPQAAIFVQYA